ncbi:hypothetical protein O3P69_019289 [Scylla paramamosain]|uniref:Uncharacterized protein n=1 Tax=Scylla paramamosain TaxID=85552 RepID=A0AAW0SVB3_SCYPA
MDGTVTPNNEWWRVRSALTASMSGDRSHGCLASSHHHHKHHHSCHHLQGGDCDVAAGG